MLKVLPPHISNLIAAGEVVQRPASVVKELVENSIDAGADDIKVIISDSGKTLINVIDNGSGMNFDDAILCFERHATSKINCAKDLESIISYGFRGEALASIAAVAEVTLKTRKEESEVGTIVEYAESKLLSAKETTCPIGTNISIRNIFYNIPARRKFLKSDAYEFKQIYIEFIRIALCRPNTGLKLSHNGKDILTLKPVSSTKQRIAEIAGKTINKELADISAHTDIINISGFIGTPESSKKTQPNQFFFLNGRFFRSPYLNKAILKSYEKLIPEGHYPSYFIYMTADPASIDVNIHPTKTEIKFEEEHVIFDILQAAIKEALGTNSLGPSIEFDTLGAPDIPVYKPGHYTAPPKIDYDPLFNPFETAPKNIDFFEDPNNREPLEEPRDDSNDSYYPTKQIFDDTFALGNSILTHKKYILTTMSSGLLVVNIFRARERVFYERFLYSLDNFTPISQNILFPIVIELEPISISILGEDPNKLRLLGYDIEIVNETTIEVKGLPDGFSTEEEDIRENIEYLVSTISDVENSDMSLAPTRHNIALALANSAARSLNNHPINNIEAQLLIDSLFACNEPDRTPEGRKCMSLLSTEELDNKFNI